MKNDILCPSACCKPGADLLGIVLGSGMVSLLPVPLKINDAFVEIAKQGRRPEKRFRFAAPCLECGCQQWNEGRCGVIDRCSAEIDSQKNLTLDIPKCSIRSQCRWFRQNGVTACRVCQEVVTDVSEGFFPMPEIPKSSVFQAESNTEMVSNVRDKII